MACDRRPGSYDHDVLPGVITVWDQPHAFEWTWGGDVLRWELAETSGGTRLTFTVWFTDPDTPIPMVAAGYHLWLDALQEHLDAGAGTPIAERDPGPVERLYQHISQ